jgi:hypothetical protein
MNKYKIEVHSIGYEDTALVVEAVSRDRIHARDILQAKVAWCEYNDIHLCNIELPFTRITKL